MRILYGVQGTGNGHLTRARCLAPALSRNNIEVDYVFSGRPKDKYFDMELFGDARYFTGLTFATRNHRLHKLDTLKTARPFNFIRETRALDTSQYDLILSDYEPVTAWSSRFSGPPLLGIGHQYAFESNAPRPGGDPISSLLLKYFAPAKTSLGMHWHHFDGCVLPPMVEAEMTRSSNVDDFTLVYLPFAEAEHVIQILKRLDDHKFRFYSPKIESASVHRNVAIFPVSREAFKQDLTRAARIICSAGFELISEALHIGTPVLAIPLSGQIEQLGNAMALEQLNLATVSDNLSLPELEHFLRNTPVPVPMGYPDVASEIAHYCQNWGSIDEKQLTKKLWKDIEPKLKLKTATITENQPLQPNASG